MSFSKTNLSESSEFIGVTNYNDGFILIKFFGLKCLMIQILYRSQSTFIYLV